EGIVHTALREAREEIGINDKDVTILGQLTELFIPVSNYIVYPVLGYMNYQPKLIPEEREVKQVLEVNLSHLLEAERIKRKKIEIRGYTIDTPYFDLENQFVWGATAMILSELKELIGEVMPQSSK
ncbi:MAG: CoA pyrophosphatase, partial [Cyclobacteriaceae bacterium]|nr:CoA pyrophosphatase [Cyclobacteriaceae bacterium]